MQQYFTIVLFYCIFDPINTALVSITDFFQIAAQLGLKQHLIPLTYIVWTTKKNFSKYRLLCFKEERKSHVWNNMIVSNWWQHLHFWVNCPFNYQDGGEDHKVLGSLCQLKENIWFSRGLRGRSSSILTAPSFASIALLINKRNNQWQLM